MKMEFPSLRIAMVIQGYHPAIGGAEKQLKSLIPFLQKENCEIHVFTRHRAGLPLRELIDGAMVHRIPSPGSKAVASLSFTFRSILQLKKLRPDVIHAHELLSPTTTAVATKRLIGCPVVAKVLGGGSLGDLAKLHRQSIGNQRIGFYARSVDQFIAVSNEIEKELADSGIPEAKIRFIPNGVDSDRYIPCETSIKDKIRRELQLPDGPIAVYTGRLAPEKNLESLIQLWPSIRDQHPLATLLILGSGEEQEKLHSMRIKGVHLMGSIPDVMPYLQSADLFVLPSEREGLSNSMLEAMSCGLPVVATQVGGAVDVIQSGKNGFLIPFFDHQAFRNVLVQLMGDSHLRQEVGFQARQTILKKYSLVSTARMLRLLYESLLRPSTGTSVLDVTA